MTLFFYNIIPDSFNFLLTSFVSAFIVYYLIFISKSSTLSFLHIPANKSPTNAKLLGGLGISAGFFATFAMISFFEFDFNTFSKVEFDHLKVAAFSILLLTISGYIDDRFELRARYKLMFQFTAISLFAFTSAKEIAQSQHGLIFVASSILGVLLINGSNLLDGLDTLTIKLGFVTSLAFIYLGIKSESAMVIFLSVSTIAALSAFYFFNREPARIYLGEIGGSVLGFVYYLQGTLAYEKLIKFGNGYKATSWVIIACSLPLCELGISFCRRCLMKKSPFRGDKLHLHHILKAKYKFSASNVSTVMALFYGCTFVLGYVISKFVAPELGAVVSISTILGFYVNNCFESWKNTKKINQFENLFLIFEGKPVHLLDSDLLNNVHVQIEANKEPERRRAAKQAA